MARIKIRATAPRQEAGHLFMYDDPEVVVVMDDGREEPLPDSAEVRVTIRPGETTEAVIRILQPELDIVAAPVTPIMATALRRAREISRKLHGIQREDFERFFDDYLSEAALRKLAAEAFANEPHSEMSRALTSDEGGTTPTSPLRLSGTGIDIAKTRFAEPSTIAAVLREWIENGKIAKSDAFDHLANHVITKAGVEGIPLPKLEPLHPHNFPCGYCEAKPGEPCRDEDGDPRRAQFSHSSRGSDTAGYPGKYRVDEYREEPIYVMTLMQAWEACCEERSSIRGLPRPETLAAMNKVLTAHAVDLRIVEPEKERLEVLAASDH